MDPDIKEVISFCVAGGIIIWFLTGLYHRSKAKSDANNYKSGGTNSQLVERKGEQIIPSVWKDIPTVINSETIAREMGWSLERYKAYLDVQKREFLRVAPDFGDKLYSEELILRWVRPLLVHCWQIVLTDKRVLYKIADVADSVITGRDIFNHWYKDLVEVKPEWLGDLGSHIEGGGGYVWGWVWEGTGSTWGQQNPIQTVQHHADCYVTIREQNGSGQKFPFRYIINQNDMDTVRDFIAMLNKLVNLAWGK